MIMLHSSLGNNTPSLQLVESLYRRLTLCLFLPIIYMYCNMIAIGLCYVATVLHDNTVHDYPLQEGANVTHIVGKLDSVLQKVADHRQEVMTNVVLVSPPAGHAQHSPSPSANYQRQRSSLDVSGQYTGIIATAHPTPLKERIQQMRLSISEQENQLLSSQVSVNERDMQRSSRSSLPSTAESSGEHLPSSKTVESSM